MAIPDPPRPPVAPRSSRLSRAWRTLNVLILVVLAIALTGLWLPRDGSTRLVLYPHLNDLPTTDAAARLRYRLAGVDAEKVARVDTTLQLVELAIPLESTEGFQRIGHAFTCDASRMGWALWQPFCWFWPLASDGKTLLPLGSYDDAPPNEGLWVEWSDPPSSSSATRAEPVLCGRSSALSVTRSAVTPWSALLHYRVAPQTVRKTAGNLDYGHPATGDTDQVAARILLLPLITYTRLKGELPPTYEEAMRVDGFAALGEHLADLIKWRRIQVFVDRDAGMVDVEFAMPGTTQALMTLRWRLGANEILRLPSPASPLHAPGERAWFEFGVDPLGAEIPKYGDEYPMHWAFPIVRKC